MLQTAQLDKMFWAEALSTAIYIRNRVTSQSLPKLIAPFQIWLGKTPDLSSLRTFGVKYWLIVPKNKIKKLDARSREGFMMGYSASKLIASRDVTFQEYSETLLFRK